MNRDIFMGDLEMDNRNNMEIDDAEYSLAHLHADGDEPEGYDGE